MYPHIHCPPLSALFLCACPALAAAASALPTALRRSLPAAAEKVGLPFDPDLFDHLVTHG
jgi:hypothetical protein